MRLLIRVSTWNGLLAGLLSVVVLGLSWISVAGLDPTGNPDHGLVVLVLGRILPLTVLAWIAVKVVSTRWALAQMDRYDIRETSDRPTPLPGRQSPNVAALAALGFRQFGAFEARLPWADWQPCWVMLDQSQRVVALISRCGQPLLSTFWPDGTHLSTWTTRRVWDTSTARSRHLVVNGDLGLVYARHIEEAQRGFLTRLGDPIAVIAMGDVIAAQKACVEPDKAAAIAMWRKPQALLPYVALALVSVATIAFA